MQCGIVGPPLSGKSTLFTILTGTSFDAAELAKREPKVGVAKLPDERIDKLAEIYSSKKKSYAAIEYVDVPGRTSSVEKREPFPAAYLAALRQTDMLALVIRDFENPTVPHPFGGVDPERDINETMLEFVVNDLDIIERRMEKLAKLHDKDSKAESVLLERCKEALSDGMHLRELDLTERELKTIRGYAFLSLKPLLIVINAGEENAPEAWANTKKMRTKFDSLKKNVEWVPVAAGIESEISQLDEEEREPFLAELGFKLPALKRVLKATYNLMGLITFLTGGDKEAHAWSVPQGSNAVKAAAAIHNDLARGFIRAEVFQYDEILEAGSEAALKKEGKIRLDGKDYIVKDGDVLFIRFNV